jgi:SnoaL-like domain
MQDSPDLRNIINSWFDAAAKGDAGWRDHHVSQVSGLRIVGTDPDELLQGAQAYEFLKDEAAMIGGRVAIEVRDVEAFEEGSVGWGLALPEITLAGGLKVSPRWSAVFHKEGVDWKLVQLHASVAQANEAAFGDTFAP